jgi:hypothetical protein
VRVPDRGDRVRARAVDVGEQRGEGSALLRPARGIVLVDRVAERVELAQQLAAPRRVDVRLVHHADQHAQVLGEVPGGGIEPRELAALEREPARRGGRLVRRGVELGPAEEAVAGDLDRDVKTPAGLRAQGQRRVGAVEVAAADESVDRLAVAPDGGLGVGDQEQVDALAVPVLGHRRLQVKPPGRPQRSEGHAEVRLGGPEPRRLLVRDAPDRAGDAHRRERAPVGMDARPHARRELPDPLGGIRGVGVQHVTQH